MDLSKLLPVEDIPNLSDSEKSAYKLFLKEVDYSPKYSESLEELPSRNFDDVSEEQIEIILNWISDYIQRIGNIFDNYESEHLKMSQAHDLSVRFLSRYRPKDYDPSHTGNVYVNTLEIFDPDQSPESIYALFKEFHDLINFEEYLVANFYYQIDNFPEIPMEETYAKIKEIYKATLSGNMQSMEDLLNNKQSWETKVEIWKRAEAKALTTLLEHQRRLLFNSPFPGNYVFTPISRDLSFTLTPIDKSIAGSIYDSFVTCKPSRTIPFIRIDRRNYTDNGRDTQYAIYSYSVGDSNKWKNYDEDIDKHFNDNINFNIQGDTLSFLIDINEDGNYSRGILSAYGFSLSVPNEVKLSEIEEIIAQGIFDTFGFTVSDVVEVSIKLKTKFEAIYNETPMHIDPTLFQFYLLSDKDLRMYINESDNVIGDKRRIKIENSESIFFQEKEEYIINFDISNPLDIYITGPDRAKTENYFNNVFRRILNGYIIRQNEISNALLNQFIPENDSEESEGSERTDTDSDIATIRGSAKKPLKKKIAKSVLKTRAVISSMNKGMEIDKSKNDSIKKLLPEWFKRVVKEGDKGWARKCQCNKQPILITDDEVKDWESFKPIIKYKGKTQSVVKREVRNFVLPDGRSVNFVCPTNTFPYIRLIKRPKKGDMSLNFYPCCWGTPFDEMVEQEDIIVNPDECKGCTSGSLIVDKVNNVDDITSVKGGSVSSTTIFKGKPVPTIALDYNKLPSSLIRFLSYGDLNERQQDYRIYDIGSKGNSEIISKNSLLECLLLATGNKDYLKESKINTRTKENVLLRYRRYLAEKVDPMAYVQEIYDITLRDIENEILNFNIPLIYRRHYHGLEELFKVHIYSFVITHRKPNQESDDFILEIPRYQVGHFKTLYVDRPVVIIVSSQVDPTQYNLVISNSSNSKMFAHLSRYLHTAFTSTHETVSNVVSKYYGSNLYSRINWENFFGKGKITAQEIDSFGKVRVFQIDNKLTISVPPTQPINVPRISEYRMISEKECLELFGEPESYDVDGFWYPWLDFKDAIYVLVEHNRSDVRQDKFSMQVSLFRSTFMVSDILKERLKYQKACNALVQIIHWAWRLDYRPPISLWWSSHVKQSSQYDQNTILPKLIKITFPPVTETSTSIDAFKWASTWWPEVFSSGSVRIYPQLYDKLTKFFQREAEVMERYTQDLVPPILFKIYENSADYPEIDNRIIFTTKKRFSDWIDNRSHTISRFYDKVPNDLSFFIHRTPIRILHWNRIVLLQNVSSGKYEDALYVAAYWAKYHINLGNLEQEYERYKDRVINQTSIRGNSMPIDVSAARVTVYAVSKIMTLIPYDKYEPEQATDLDAYVVVSPTGIYSALLI